MITPNVSVVIPVYNTENYVEEAVVSIQNQTLKNIEIIIINDGSTDNSLEIINKLSKNDIRIRIYTQENQGLSITRNKGIILSTGSYIYFMDSDDYLEVDTLKICYEKCEQYKLDFVLFDAEILDIKNSSTISLNYQRKNYTDEYKTYKGIDILNILLDNKCYTPSACLNFINRAYLVQTNNTFYPKIIHEDQLFTCILYLEAQRVMCIHENLFKRRIRINSIMTTPFSRKNMESYFTISDQLILYSVNHKESHSTIDKYLFQMLNNAAWISYRLPLKDRIYIASQYIKKYKKYIKFKNLLLLLFKRMIKN